MLPLGDFSLAQMFKAPWSFSLYCKWLDYFKSKICFTLTILGDLWSHYGSELLCRRWAHQPWWLCNHTALSLCSGAEEGHQSSPSSTIIIIIIIINHPSFHPSMIHHHHHHHHHQQQQKTFSHQNISFVQDDIPNLFDWIWPDSSVYWISAVLAISTLYK